MLCRLSGKTYRSNIYVYGGDRPPADFAYEPITSGKEAVPGEYLKIAMNQMNLGLKVTIEGTTSTGIFSLEAKQLQSVRLTAEELAGRYYRGQYSSDFQFNPNIWENYHYQPLQRGVLGTGKFPLLQIISGPSYNRVSLTAVVARTITVLGESGPRVYTLTDGENNFDAAKWASLAETANTSTSTE